MYFWLVLNIFSLQTSLKIDKIIRSRNQLKSCILLQIHPPAFDLSHILSCFYCSLPPLVRHLCTLRRTQLGNFIKMFTALRQTRLPGLCLLRSFFLFLAIEIHSKISNSNNQAHLLDVWERQPLTVLNVK